MDKFHFAGFKLGFWIAQQGSIFVYVLLVYLYLKAMDKLDAKYGLNEDE